MTRRQMRDEIAQHLIGYLNASAIEIANWCGLDMETETPRGQATFEAALREMEAILRRSLARKSAS